MFGNPGARALSPPPPRPAHRARPATHGRRGSPSPPTPGRVFQKMEGALENLRAALLSFEQACCDTEVLEQCLGKWRHPIDGGVVSDEVFDENLGRILHEVAAPIHRLRTKQPSSPSKKAYILLARELWIRIVSAVERAELVKQARSRARRHLSPICIPLAEAQRLVNNSSPQIK